PVAKRLMQRYGLVGHKEEEFLIPEEDSKEVVKEKITEENLFHAIVYIVISMGIGGLLIPLSKKVGVVLPAYIGPMLVAAIIRNVIDNKDTELPLHTINVVGNISLQLFLAMALMSMKLWELAALAVPLVVILLVQTVVMALYAYFVTFRIMGKDYDAAVMASGHCGFGMGATPNAMANMESFTAANGPSPTAFFVLPLVGALFIDFTNASLITVFMNIFGK
ncbi:MAG: sodium/glutamate symporter, partial [Cetobacterium sp.]